jgi:spermidine/putrescine-binding protein
MLTGHSNFDVVVPGVANIRRQILAGAYTSLDKQRLPNLANLDEGLLETVAPSDPGNSHAAIYMWGTYGLGYNADMLEKLLPGAALDTWKLIFDPAYAKKLSGCGISLADDPAEIIRIVLLYLGKDPANPRLDDLPAVEKTLKSIRPFVRNISSVFNMDAMAQGETCIAVGYNGGFLQALQKVNESGNHLRLRYAIPTEGSLLWVDLLAIPRDAPHPDNAYQFINYLLEPEVTAKISDAILYANANKAALPFQRSSIATNPVIYPDAEDRKRLFLQTEDSPELARAITLLWQTFKSGQ